MPLSLLSHRLVFVLMLSAVLASACTITADETYPRFDDTPPRVLRTFPQNGWVQVPRSVTIKVWFSEPVEPSTVSVATMTLFSGDLFQRCRYEVSQLEDGTCLVQMRPLDMLMPGVEYQLEIYQGVSDLNGNTLLSSTGFSFTTMER